MAFAFGGNLLDLLVLAVLKNSDTYGYYLRYIKPNVSIQRCKRRIAAANKKQKEARRQHDAVA